MKAIETHYAGCRFRSRLEARWAVFFDALGIDWDYEEQGYACTARLSGHQETINYLPDFWLPELEMFAEVKGALTVDECVRLLDVAASLSSWDEGGCGTGPDTVVLGPVPRTARTPIRLHMHKGGLQATAWRPLEPPRSHCYDPDSVEVAVDYGNRETIFADTSVPGARIGPWHTRAQHIGRWLLAGLPEPSIDRRVAGAYTTARSARFEHGERG